MAKEIMQYRDLNHALSKLRSQVMEDVPYVQREIPRFTTPKQAWNWLKPQLTYKKDPKGVELFQSINTLLNDNYYGESGLGDCDCFTIAMLTILLSNGFDCGIVLAGRNPFVPVHIYNYVDTDRGRIYLDLTNPSYGQERFYPYKQHVPFKLNPQEKKQMILELAEGGKGTNRHPYIYLPSKRIQVREDYFDNMSAGEFQNMLLEENYDLGEIQELSAKRAERKAAKKASKAETKATKKTTKTETKAAKKSTKFATKAAKPKNIRKAAKVAVKQTRADKKGEGGGKEIFGKILDTATNIIGGKSDEQEEPKSKIAPQDRFDYDQDTGQMVNQKTGLPAKGPSARAKDPEGYSGSDDEQEDAAQLKKTKSQKSEPELKSDEMKVFGKPVKKKTVAIVGTIGGLALLTGIIVAVKK